MANDNVEDLIAQARRGELSEPERRRLEVALKTSESARALYEVGVDFDRMATERIGDDDLMARVETALAARAPHSGKKAKRGRRLLLLVAIGLGTSAAAASVVGFGVTKSEETNAPGASELATRASPKARAVPRAAAAKAPGEAAVEDEPSPSEDPDPAKATVDQRPAAASTPRTVTSPKLPDAKSLFKSANAERKAGRSARALAGYRHLQQSFPNSPEARLSFVLSGRLLLGQGNARGALSQFNRYLGGGGQGGLGEEALWGKAQALSRLGRGAEERQVWRTLLERYPESVYAPAARRRLQR